MNNYDFDERINRRNTNCGKWDTMDKKYGDQSLIHLGVADMDFQSPEPILKAFEQIVESGVFGYTDLNDEFYESIQRWFQKQYNITIPKEWIVFCPRINVSASICIDTLTHIGDEILIHTPAYAPLKNAIEKNKRVAVSSPLIASNDGYSIDFEQMEQAVTDRTKMLILCSPHNPTGRVFRSDEIKQLADFCEKHDLLLYSDEIHGDITAENIAHISMLDYSDPVNSRLILASSLTKTFNIPGVIISYMIIPNKNIREQIAVTIDRLGMHNPNIFSVRAVEKGYQECDDWYEAVKKYINANEIFVRQFFKNHMSDFHILPREGTYLLWINYETLKKTEQEMEKWFIEQAKVSVYMGSVFGIEGTGYIRFNLATSKYTLVEALMRMKEAYHLLSLQ